MRAISDSADAPARACACWTAWTSSATPMMGIARRGNLAPLSAVKVIRLPMVIASRQHRCHWFRSNRSPETSGRFTSRSLQCSARHQTPESATRSNDAPAPQAAVLRIGTKKKQASRAVVTGAKRHSIFCIRTKCLPSPS